MIIVYINCKLFPFIDWIISGLKTMETRNRNTLKSLVGKTVYIAETGTGKRPVVRCRCTIGYPVIITDKAVYDRHRKYTCIVPGSSFDFTETTKQKVLYPLSNVEKIKPFPVPDDIVRHGRIYCTTGENLEPATGFSETDIEQAQQWIADVYHCSDCWGNKTKYAWMKLELEETMKQKDPGDYSPPVELYKVCADYWNRLCEVFPN